MVVGAKVVQEEVLSPILPPAGPLVVLVAQRCVLHQEGFLYLTTARSPEEVVVVEEVVELVAY